MDPAAAAAAPAAATGRGPAFGPWVVVLWVATLAAVALLLFFGTGGDDLGHRSVAELAGKVPLRQGVTKVRFELQNGTLGIAPPADASAPPIVDYWGGIRRAADTAEELLRLDQVPFDLEVVADSPPDTLVLRGPVLPPGSAGLLAMELSVRIPAAIAVDVVVANSGHVTVGDRTGALRIETGRGDIRLERCAATVDAKTGRGNFIAFEHRGDLRAKTTVGDMQAFFAATGTAIELVTGRGTVQCGVPPDTEFQLDAHAEQGRIGADFGFASERVGEFGASLVGERGSGRTKVVLRTGKGHLAFRAKQSG